MNDHDTHEPIPSREMVDVVKELRKRASRAAEMRDILEDKRYWEGMRACLNDAADRVEAYPLYRSGTEAVRLLRALHDLPMGPLHARDSWPDDLHKRVDALLNTFPPEVTIIPCAQVGEPTEHDKQAIREYLESRRKTR